MLKYICRQALIRACTLDETHPLHKITASPTKIRANPLPHKAPISKLRRIFNIDPSKVEKIGRITYSTANGRIFSTVVHSSQEESIEAEQNDKATTKIFTDGLGYQGGAGAAAVIYQNGFNAPTNSLKCHLGQLMDHSTYEGEAAGLILAAWLIRLHCKNQVGTEDISIYTDCQSIVDSVYDMKPGPGQYLLNEFHVLIALLANKGKKVSKFTINWISAHSNVQGNEQVDKIAKEAAQGQSTPRIFLPPLLRRPLPIAKSALIQKAKEARLAE